MPGQQGTMTNGFGGKLVRMPLKEVVSLAWAARLYVMGSRGEGGQSLCLWRWSSGQATTSCD